MRTIVLALIIFLATSCNHVKQDATLGAKTAVTCEGQNLWQIVKDDGLTLLAEVAATLTHSSDVSWKNDLGTLEQQTKTGAVKCAAKAVVAIWNAEVSGAGSGSAAPQSFVASAHQLGLQRANEYLAGVTFR